MKKIVLLFIFVLYCFVGYGQSSGQGIVRTAYSLDDVIALAQENSPSAKIATHNFRAKYWDFRSYKAQFLPSLNVNANLGNYNRSISKVQNSEDGKYNYVSNNSLSNSLKLSVDQNIGLTGGKISLYSHLDRLDEFSPHDNHHYNSEPISISYLQPIGGYNRFKWDRKIKPKEYEKAKREYLKDMEDLTIQAVIYFFDLAIEQNKYKNSCANYDNTQKMYDIAQKRYEIGAITKNELLQLKVRLLNEGLTINDSQLQLQVNTFKLKSFLGMGADAKIDLVLPDIKNGVILDYQQVLKNSYEYSSFMLEQEVKMLNADSGIAEAKGNKGLKADLRLTFGLSQDDPDLGAVYKNLKDQEITGLSLSMPILDWGLGKGGVMMAKSMKEVIATQVEQAMIDHEQNVFLNVLKFNNQKEQCSISKEVNDITKERYGLTLMSFKNSSISVTDMNMAQSEKDNAENRYISDLKNYWIYYFTVRKLSMYDYITNTNISTEFDKIIGE